MRVLDLFSGIGGFSLGFERAGMETAAFCEIDPYCRAVLAKHWPGVPIYDDIRTLSDARVCRDIGRIDLICGGFPCQDISLAGKGAGLSGDRSGLWLEYRRLIEEIRPRWVVIENVAALRSRGLDQVLGALAALGYDAEWHCIPASAVGAPHRRDRVWIIANARGQQHEGDSPADEWARAQELPEATMADADNIDRGQRESQGERRRILNGLETGDNAWWAVEPAVGRVAYGVPDKLDRLKSLGNAVVPQIPEMIGRAIMAFEGEARR